MYPFFQKPDTWPATHHAHLCVAGSREERTHIAFRDALRSDPSAQEAYVQLKRVLAAIHHGETLSSREACSLAKTAFVRRILAEAGL